MHLRREVTMQSRFAISAIAAGALVGMTAMSSAQQPMTIRAGMVIDGKGGVQRNAVIAIDGSKIARIGDAGMQPATYDFSRFTVLPGLIDAHVHVGAHFGKDGKSGTPGETPAE